MFIVMTNSGEAIEMHFVSFVAREDGTAEVLSLPWRPQQSPRQYLDRLAHELLPRLSWPVDTNDAVAWTDAWRGAFVLRHGETILSADRLAERMADVAIRLRASVLEALRKEKQQGPFHRLLAAVGRELLADVDEAKFADMCAQTLVYGTLTGRVTDPIGFGASPTLTVVPLANPFLAAFFEQVHDQVVALELPDGGLDALVADLRTTNVEAILDKFGDNSKGGDPVVHFYEEFLKRYDRKMRADAGAFYTPQPVVEFMVRAVDEVMRTTFGLTEGLADRSTWETVAHHLSVNVPKGVDPSSSFVSMLDPATGTGTYLVEWMRRAESSFKSANPRGNWSARLRDFVLPSMHAFEMMLAPYAIAHLKVALEAHAEGLDGGSVSIHLTDTLEHPAAQASFETMTDPVAEEGRRAAELKLDQRFTVIIGNPPYDREAHGSSDGGPRKGGVVRHGAAGAKPLLEDFLEPLRVAGLAGKHARSLYNDYVYFWRWATWQTAEHPPGPGVVAFITARSFLDGVSFGGVRSYLRRQFDELFVFDLGGDGLSSALGIDENVFDIRVPVAICIAVRLSGEVSPTCTVRYRRIGGTRLEKFNVLRECDLQSCATEVLGAGLEPFVPGSDDAPGWVPLEKLMPWTGRGIQFSRTWPVGPSKSVVTRRWKALVNVPRAGRSEMLKESRDAQVGVSYRSFLSARQLDPVGRLQPGDEPDGYRQVAYRSFDTQWCIADRRVIDMPRPSLWSSLNTQQVFLVTLTGTAYGTGQRAMVTPYVPDLNAFNARGGLVFPLWRDGNGSEPNLTRGLLARLTKTLGLVVTPDEILAYVYGLLGTAAFGEWVAQSGFPETSPPRIPVTADPQVFAEVVEIGRQLIWLHTGGERFEPRRGTPFPQGTGKEQSPVRTYPESYSYDKKTRELTIGDGRFATIDLEVWSYEVSGLKVVQSWLGNRMAAGKGKKSSPLDDIRPERWTFTTELLQLLAIIEQTVLLTPVAADLIARVVAGPLILAADLPEPTEAERKASGV